MGQLTGKDAFTTWSALDEKGRKTLKLAYENWNIERSVANNGGRSLHWKTFDNWVLAHLIDRNGSIIPFGRDVYEAGQELAIPASKVVASYEVTPAGHTILNVEIEDGDDEDDSYDEEYGIRAGFAYVLMEYDEAVEAFKKVIAEMPHDPWPYDYKGEYIRAEKNANFHMQEIGRWVLEFREELAELLEGEHRD